MYSVYASTHALMVQEDYETCLRDAIQGPHKCIVKMASNDANFICIVFVLEVRLEPTSLKDSKLTWLPPVIPNKV